jgi:transcriptional regulator with XRE-family HTH domain
MTRAEEMQRLRDEERLTLSEIGERYGISRQRVAQVIGNQGNDVELERLEEFKQERLEVVQRVVAGEISVAEASEISGITQRSFKMYALDTFGIKLSHTAPLHGTPYRYSRGCRCDECKEAQRELRRQMKERGPKKHGTMSAYTNYSCRCTKCKRWAKRNYAERRRDDSHAVND